MKNLTESLDLITGIKNIIIGAKNEASDQIEELDINEVEKVNEIFRPDFGLYTSLIQVTVLQATQTQSHHEY